MKRRTQYGPPIDKAAHEAAYHHAWAILSPLHRQPSYERKRGCPLPHEGFTVKLQCLNNKDQELFFQCNHGLGLCFINGPKQRMGTIYKSLRPLKSVADRLTHYRFRICGYQKIWTNPLTFVSLTALIAALTPEPNDHEN